MQHRNYKVTVVFDVREQKESAEAMQARIGKLMESLGGEILEQKAVGLREFARRGRGKISLGSYSHYSVRAGSSFNGELMPRLRLDKTVNRILIENI